jgi:tetratricopeptide (TPR) repeat protein
MLILGLAAATHTRVTAQDFSTSLEAHPTPQNSPQSAAIQQADEALATHNYGKAVSLLTPLVAANPKDAALAYDLAAGQDALDQTEPAEKNYRLAIGDDPALMAPRVALGLLFARQGNFTAAREQFAAAVALPPASSPSSPAPPSPAPLSSAAPSPDALLRARAFRALARIDQKQRPADASDELLSALKLTPETPEDTLLTAELAQAAGNGAVPAESTYRRILASDPTNNEAIAALAHLLVQQKRAAEAEAVLRSGLKAHPADPTLSIQLAALLGDEGQSAKALPLVESLHITDPANPDITRALTRLYLDTGNDTKAEPLLAMLIAQHPRDTSLLDDRARALIHLKRFAEAQQILTPLVAQPSLFPTPADLGDAAGDLAFTASENNDPAAALQALAVRATVFSPSPPILFLAAISEDHLHHVPKAREAYRQFLAAAKGSMPDQEFEAQHRLVTLEHTH